MVLRPTSGPGRDALGRERHIWIGTFGSGARLHDGQTVRTFTSKDGLADNYVMAILQDREGDIWFGTKKG